METVTPKEKAKELLDKFKEHSQLMIGYGGLTSKIGTAKQCALIAVDEILETVVVYDDISNDYQFWQQVKQEIKKL